MPVSHISFGKETVIDDLIRFIGESPTAWHTAEAALDRLVLAGFIFLEEGKPWNIEMGKSYVVVRGGSLAAFRMPKEKVDRMSIIGAHTDSPTFFIKPKPELTKGGFLSLQTEVYGSPIYSTWVGRDLHLAGRVFYQKGSHETVEELVYLKDSPLFIPSLAIHLDRDVNKDGSSFNPQTQLNPIGAIINESLGSFSYIETALSKTIDFDHLLSFDLALVPAEAPRLMGLNHEMISSARLDNLTSSHAALTAIGKTEASKDVLQMIFLWNHEEIGSMTYEGADSTFFTDTTSSALGALGSTHREMIAIRAKSFCISVDVSHGMHPNYTDKTDPNHSNLLGSGIAIKYNAKQKYATNGATAARIAMLCKKAGIAFQHFAGKSDVPSGSTIGSIFASRVGIPTADIGVPLLGMHASRELIASSDHQDMCLLLQTALEN